MLVASGSTASYMDEKLKSNNAKASAERIRAEKVEILFAYEKAQWKELFTQLGFNKKFPPFDVRPLTWRLDRKKLTLKMVEGAEPGGVRWMRWWKYGISIFRPFYPGFRTRNAWHIQLAKELFGEAKIWFRFHPFLRAPFNMRNWRKFHASTWTPALGWKEARMEHLMECFNTR